MASFIGSAAPGGAMVVLARNVAVPVNTTAATVLCTPAQTCNVLYAVVRAGATAFGSTTSFSIGVTGSLASLVATSVATSLPTTVAYTKLVATAGSTAAPLVIAAGATIYWSCAQIDGGTATTAACDLIGYLY